MLDYSTVEQMMQSSLLSCVSVVYTSSAARIYDGGNHDNCLIPREQSGYYHHHIITYTTPRADYGTSQYVTSSELSGKYSKHSYSYTILPHRLMSLHVGSDTQWV